LGEGGFGGAPISFHALGGPLDNPFELVVSAYF
jgi:hypothetical protein